MNHTVSQNTLANPKNCEYFEEDIYEKHFGVDRLTLLVRYIFFLTWSYKVKAAIK